MRESDDREIDGYVYTVRHMTPMAALSTLADLVAVVGPVLGDVVGKGDIKNALDADIGPIVQGLVSACEDDKRKEKALSIVKRLQGTTIYRPVGGGAQAQLDGTFELHFLGRLGALMKWCAFAVGHQYGDFFKLLGSATPSLPSSGRSTGSSEAPKA